MGVGRNFSRGGGNINILLVLVRLLTRCNANVRSRNVLPFLHHNTTKNTNVTTIVTKLRFVGSHSQVYYDNFHNRLSADFQGRVLLFTEVLPWSLTKPQITAVFYLARPINVIQKQSCKCLGSHPKQSHFQ